MTSYFNLQGKIIGKKVESVNFFMAFFGNFFGSFQKNTFQSRILYLWRYFFGGEWRQC